MPFPHHRHLFARIAAIASLVALCVAGPILPADSAEISAERTERAKPIGTVRLKVKPTVPSLMATNVVVKVRLSKKPAKGSVKVKEGGRVLARAVTPARKGFKVKLELSGLKPGNHKLRAVYRIKGHQKGITSSLVVVNSIAGCAPVPHLCGYPDATNTGPRAGVVLRSVPDEVTSGPGWKYDSRGWIEVQDGGQLTGVRCECGVNVEADNVLIADSEFVESGEGFGIALRHTDGVTIRNNIIRGPVVEGPARLLVGVKDIYGDSTGLQILANDLSMSSTGVQVESGLVADNYIHDLGFTDGDHTNGTTSNGGSSYLELRHNTVFNPWPQTDAISLFQDFGAQRNRLITDNLLAGGGYSLYAGANPGKESTTSNIVVTNNRFARLYFPKAGYYGPATAYFNGNGNQWIGNVWDDTGAAVHP